MPEHTFPLASEDELLGDAWLARSAPFDPFEFDVPLGRAHHVLRLANPAQPIDLHTAHLEPLPMALRTAGRPREPQAIGKKRQPMSLMSQLAWGAIALGIGAFVCGAILVGWSLFGSRPELWDLGLPIALGGQAALVVGLLLQLGRADDEEADDPRAEIEALYQQVDAMQHSQRLTATSATHSYYTDPGISAMPDAKLAELKGQLDSLAVRMQEPHR
ncbi:MAG: hypothetical protein KF708_11835 [Pirellulales bacterium]|nr:hypothetical protein [Pirellulales bacterium]